MSRDRQPDRREIEELIPWHAAGTLNRRDAERVDAALAEDPELAREYQRAREELAGDAHLNETLGAPSARLMDQVFARIDAEPVRRRSPFLDLGERVADFVAGLSPRALALATAAAGLVIVVQAGVIGVGAVNRPTAPAYQTASAPTAAQSTGAVVLLRFAPDAGAEAVTRLLESRQASIVGGPTAGGIYRVRVATTVLPKARLAAIARDFQREKVVEFAAPSQ